MIEILGYLFLYLIVGVVLLPIQIVADEKSHLVPQRWTLIAFTISWPAAVFLMMVILWVFTAWEGIKNYK